MKNIMQNTIIDNSSDYYIKDESKECNFTLDSDIVGGRDKFVDNSKSLTMLNILKTIINDKDNKINHIDIATGYWDIPGVTLLTDVLEEFFKRGGVMRLLIGQDPYLMLKYNKNPKYSNESGLKYADFLKGYIKSDLDNIEVKDEYKKSTQLLLRYCNTDKLQIRLHTKNEDGEPQFFHAKCYILYNKRKTSGANMYGNAYGIIGSSNFTKKGLCENSELNYLETNTALITYTNSVYQKSHIAWFNQKWEEGIDWGRTFLEEVLKTSKIGQVVIKEEAKKASEQKTSDGAIKVLTPYECYIKMLQDQFSPIIDGDGKVKEEEFTPSDPDFKKLEYQKEAVYQAFAIMKVHNGFILSDVVGLGKTYTALMVAKKHLIETNFLYKVLIIAPAAIKNSWVDAIGYFDKWENNAARKLKAATSVTTIGTMDNFEEGIPDNDIYSMIIIDESHHFRNSETTMYDKLDCFINEDTNALGHPPYIALLSATPQNNRPRDLLSQIKLFERTPIKSTLDNLGNKYGRDITKYLNDKDNEYKNFIAIDIKGADRVRIPKTDEQIEEDHKKLKELGADIRLRVVEPLVIRRTRRDIRNYYKKDIKTQGLIFPKIEPPRAIEYKMDSELARLFSDTIDIIVQSLKSEYSEGEYLHYYRYRALEYLDAKYKPRYEKRNIKVQSTVNNLASMMEATLVKRLESSQNAFRESLGNMKYYTQNMIEMWNEDRIFICPDLDMRRELSRGSVAKHGGFSNTLDYIERKAKKFNEKRGKGDNTNAQYKKSDFIKNPAGKSYIDLLNEDLNVLDDLIEKWDEQDDDPKLDKFIEAMDGTFLDKDKNPTGKLVIFSECIATQKLLEEALINIGHKVLSITADNRDDNKDIIMQNFDENYTGEKKNDYNILVTTDVLSEGVNLHRSNTIINYDSPWNATRLMQRLGRVNRIGSKAQMIYNYNFYPSTQGDNEINLQNRTYVKLQAFHELFGEDSQIYSTKEEVRVFEKARWDDSEESPLLPYIKELKEYRDEHASDYEELLHIQKALCLTHCDNTNSEIAASMSNNNLYYTVGDKTLRQGQLEIFERLKEWSKGDAILIDDKDALERYNNEEKRLIEACKADIAKSNIRGGKTSKKGKTEADKATKTLKNLSTKVDAATRHDIDIISDEVNAGNRALIKQVNSRTFDAGGLGLDTIKSDISALLKYTKKEQLDIDIAAKIIFIAE